MALSLFLVDDDQPDQFEARELTVLRDDVQVAGKPALVVRIHPPIAGASGGSLKEALLVARHANVQMQEIRDGRVAGRASVFVCRFKGEHESLPVRVGKDDVSIVFWGRVLDSPRGRR